MRMRLFSPVLALVLAVAPVQAQDQLQESPLHPAGEEAAVPGDPGTGEELEEADTATAEEALEGADEEISPAAVQALASARKQMDALAALLAAVVDTASADSHALRIVAACEALRNLDLSALAEEDEELVAAVFAEDMFILLDHELARLADADYFGNNTLEGLFSSPAVETASKPAPTAASSESAADAPAPEAGTESALPDAAAVHAQCEPGAPAPKAFIIKNPPMPTQSHD